jgi:hypothetical protein
VKKEEEKERKKSLIPTSYTKAIGRQCKAGFVVISEARGRPCSSVALLWRWLPGTRSPPCKGGGQSDHLLVI